MKLRKGFITHNTKDQQIMVGVGKADFSGMIKSNKTAAFIIDCLKTETSREEILAKLKDKFDGSEDVMRSDIDKVIQALKSVNALDM